MCKLYNGVEGRRQYLRESIEVDRRIVIAWIGIGNFGRHD